MSVVITQTTARRIYEMHRLLEDGEMRIRELEGQIAAGRRSLEQQRSELEQLSRKAVLEVGVSAEPETAPALSARWQT